MFGRKKKPIKKPKVSAEMQVIPGVFYGAQDPVIHYAETDSKKVAKVQKGQTRNWNLGGILEVFKKKWVWYSILAVIFIIIIVLISWYYVNEAKRDLQPEVVEPVIEQPAVVEEEPEAVIVEPEAVEEIVTSTEEEVEPQELLSLQERVLEFPRILQTNSSDVDSDALTDMEEEIFNTDSGNWDTDNDGYYDGQEVYNLYNPAGEAPVKLIDSGLVAEYVNPIWQYRVYYPASWQVGAVDTRADQVLFSTVTGDFIEISAFTKEAQESFIDWFARKAVGERYSELQTLTNRFKESGQKRKDDLVAYFVQGNNVYVLIYHPGTTGFVPFRHVMQVMQQSFRPSKTIIDIPDQVPLPIPPSFTEEAVTTTTSTVEEN